MTKAESPRETRLIGNSPDLEHMFPGKQDFMSAWSSPEKFAEHVKNMDRKKAWEDSAWTGSEGFTGTKDMQEALSYASGGWKEGTDRVVKMRDRILAMHPIQKRPIKYDVVGSIPSIARAVAGDPKNMVQPDGARSRRRPVLTFISSFAANCGVSAGAITNRAAIVCALIDHIEAAGYACEVVAAALSKGWQSEKTFQAVTAVTVKNSNQPVDVVRLAYALGHSSFFRRFVFADWQYDKVNERGLGPSLGCSYKITPEQYNEKDIYFIPSVEGNAEKFKTEEAACTKGLTFLRNSLIEQKCPAFRNMLTEEQKKDIVSDYDEDEE